MSGRLEEGAPCGHATRTICDLHDMTSREGEYEAKFIRTNPGSARAESVLVQETPSQVDRLPVSRMNEMVSFAHAWSGASVGGRKTRGQLRRPREICGQLTNS
eukprot:4947439-Pleurochrysis_carterae.AAC.2